MYAPNVNLQMAPLFRQGKKALELRPYAEARIHTREFSLDLSIDEHGRRVGKGPAGPARVAFLGDSFTFGCWAPMGEQWLDCLGQRVINLGMPNAGTDWAWWWLTSHPLEADRVVVAFFVGNDFADNLVGFQSYRLDDGLLSLDEAARARLTPAVNPPAQDGPLPELPPFQALTPPAWPDVVPTTGGSPLRRFTLYQFGAALAHNTPGLRVQQPEFWYLRSAPAPYADGVTATWRALDGVLSECRKHGKTLELIAIPAKTQVNAEEWQAFLKRSKLAENVFDRDRPQKLLEQWCTSRGVRWLDLRAHLAGDTYYRRDMHWNAAGHRQAAAAAQEFLRAGPETVQP